MGSPVGQQGQQAATQQAEETTASRAAGQQAGKRVAEQHGTGSRDNRQQDNKQQVLTGDLHIHADRG